MLRRGRGWSRSSGALIDFESSQVVLWLHWLVVPAAGDGQMALLCLRLQKNDGLAAIQTSMLHNLLCGRFLNSWAKLSMLGCTKCRTMLHLAANSVGQKVEAIIQSRIVSVVQVMEHGIHAIFRL